MFTWKGVHYPVGVTPTFPGNYVLNNTKNTDVESTWCNKKTKITSVACMYKFIFLACPHAVRLYTQNTDT